MSDHTDRRPKFDPQAVLEAERRGLIAHRDELASEHDRIVRHIGEGRELLRRMIGHGEEATLTIDLYQRQALPE
ncbi:MAG: hypothetical protein Q8Q85_14605, partial [Gemmatimonadales bacterium]|nr:hypothetical protein [Gemmatimonadales bacterium]